MISTRSMSAIMPVRRRIFCVARMGPVSMITGSEPTTTVSSTRARGLSPRSFTARLEARRTPLAPSTMPLELPAWIFPFGRKEA